MIKQSSKIWDDNYPNIFAISNFLDQCRWSGNYKEKPFCVNYIDENADIDSLILSHYLCYITDRQMPYEKIWDIGGYVFSSWIKDFSKGKTTMELLTPREDGFVLYDNQKEKMAFCCANLTKHNSSQYNKLGDLKNSKQVIFKSRFITTDYRSIYNTLYILENDYNKSIIKYLTEIIRLNSTHTNDIILRLAFALYILSYENIKNRNKDEELIEYVSKTPKFAKEQLSRIHTLLSSTSNFDNEYQNWIKNKGQFRCKRVWCCIRDYIKDGFYNAKFAKKLQNVLEDDIRSQKFLDQLELPGDVWNNNSTFITCNFPTKSAYQNTSFNEFLRQLWDQHHNKLTGYIEQFDMTFSLASRVCEKTECACCPFGIVHHKASLFKELCTEDTQHFCPLVLYSTGYKTKCIGTSKCVLYNIYNSINH